ncbi:MAG: acyl transferase [Flammeovirgaceae bacterium]|nr:MAG: acyl transferase [Flammeovirgaceae bacterium]
MEKPNSFQSQIYTVNEATFGNIALSVFRYQALYNPVYSEYIKALGIKLQEVNAVHEIPFLPIDFFKTHPVKTGNWNEETIFTSSGTTGTAASSHHICDASFYHNNARLCFEYFFGSLTDHYFLALLPSYLERSNSSLVSMIRYFIELSGLQGSGFYLNNFTQLVDDVMKLQDEGKRKIVVWGVSFALLDLAEKVAPDFSNCLVFETGGMKGRRREITREELHQALKQGLHVERIFSEYGMTELLSQAYTGGGARFKCPPWMRVMARDMTDPLQVGQQNKTGGLNVIDLANIHTAAFIETADMGIVFEDGSFEVLGRLDNAEIRGCNLLVE